MGECRDQGDFLMGESSRNDRNCGGEHSDSNSDQEVFREYDGGGGGWGWRDRCW